MEANKAQVAWAHGAGQKTVKIVGRRMLREVFVEPGKIFLAGPGEENARVVVVGARDGSAISSLKWHVDGSDSLCVSASPLLGGRWQVRLWLSEVVGIAYGGGGVRFELVLKDERVLLARVPVGTIIAGPRRIFIGSISGQVRIDVRMRYHEVRGIESTGPDLEIMAWDEKEAGLVAIKARTNVRDSAPQFSPGRIELCDGKVEEVEFVWYLPKE